MLIGVDEPQTTTTSDPELLIEEARALQRRRQRRQTTALSVAGIVVIIGVGAYRIELGDHAAPAPRPRPIAAVARRAVVVYEKVETVVSIPNLPTLRRTGEVWFSPSAPGTYRELLTIAGGPTVEVGARLVHDPRLGAEQLVYLFDAKTNTIYATGAFLVPSAPRPSPQRAFRHFLAVPGVRLERPRVFEGHTVYAAVEYSTPTGGAVFERLYVDAATYQPLLEVAGFRGATRDAIRVLAYRTLPATPTNLDLTRLARAHPGARVVPWPPPPRVDQLYGEASQLRGGMGPFVDLGPFG
jgi:hypothetical protein